MKREAFDDLVKWVEARYSGQPGALEQAVARWLRIGRAALLAWIFGLALAGVALCIAGFLMLSEPRAAMVLLVLGVLLLAYGLSQVGFLLFSEPIRPEGRLLGPGEAPELRALLDELGRRLDCRRFDEVRVSLAFNAGVTDVPRLMGGLGRSTLDIGLPLAMMVTPEELRAILAHEFAHLSGRHGVGSNRIYRLLRAWSQVVARMQAPITGTVDGTVRGAILRFLGWYWPRLHARAVVLSRLHEFHADSVGAEVAGPATMAAALWRTECRSAWIFERFWPTFHGLADEQPEPPEDLFERLRQAVEVPPDSAESMRWIDRSLGQLTDNDSSHPVLPERLIALGQTPASLRAAGFPGAASPSAASLLGPSLPLIERELAEKWRQSARASWRERNRWAAAQARRSAKPSAGEHPVASSHDADADADADVPAVWNVDDEAEATEPTAAPPFSPAEVAALWDRARETAEHRGPEAAEPILNELLSRAPDHVGGTVMLGHCKLRRGDLDGERLLLGVVDLADETWMRPACDLLAAHYRETGRADRLREVRARMDAHENAVENSRRERTSVEHSDDFLPHGQDDRTLEPLRTLLASQPECTGAWLVRKKLRFLPRRPLFVLCLSGKTSRWGLPGDERGQLLVSRLTPRIELPGQVLVIARNGGFRKLAARVMSLPGSRIYPEKSI
ncbi:M48 family metallopeptidase [Aquisphaera insulae]|uniref:M48 family metallopeptidase n=1 Tax=Aquisphaera insulae TaxID=2712864 RepID=UPI0013EA1EE4|nr:M48 family metallopeptidase [Aquisphaera insulae]